MDIQYELDDLKRELQGNQGLIKKLGQSFIPSSREMSFIAQKSFNGNFEYISNSLDQLLQIEYREYLKRTEDFRNQFFKLAHELNDPKYPITRDILNNSYTELRSNPDPFKHLKGILDINMFVEGSMAQSGKTRAGSSLMEHLSLILERNGFRRNSDFWREKVSKKGARVDFIFPNSQMVDRTPENCVVLSCQTTVNDRFRLGFTQAPFGTRKRTATGIGCPNFGDKLGVKSLTTSKLEEAQENNIKFVILSNVYDERLQKSPAVMSYEELFEELSTIRNFWPVQNYQTHIDID